MNVICSVFGLSFWIKLSNLLFLSGGFFQLKPRPQQQKCRSNIIETTGNKVEHCFDFVAKNGNIVEGTFDFVEATFDFVAFHDVASMLLLVYTGLKRNCESFVSYVDD